MLFWRSNETIIGTAVPAKGSRLKERLESRKQRWGTQQGLTEQEMLAVQQFDKFQTRRFMSARGIPLPGLFYEGELTADLDLSMFGERIVVKPKHGHSSKGVLLFAEGVELFSGSRIETGSRTRSAIAEIGERREIVVEELVRDVDPAFPVPRDVKVYTAGGKAWIVQVISRNGRKASRCFYPDGSPIRDRVQRAYPYSRHVGKIPRDALQETVRMAERLSQELPMMLRFDFYLTPQGAVFGETTQFPFMGKGFTRAGELALCSLMDLYPDNMSPID